MCMPGWMTMSRLSNDGTLPIEVANTLGIKQRRRRNHHLMGPYGLLAYAVMSTVRPPAGASCGILIPRSRLIVLLFVTQLNLVLGQMLMFVFAAATEVGTVGVMLPHAPVSLTLAA